MYMYMYMCLAVHQTISLYYSIPLTHSINTLIVAKHSQFVSEPCLRWFSRTVEPASQSSSSVPPWSVSGPRDAAPSEPWLSSASGVPCTASAALALCCGTVS